MRDLHDPHPAYTAAMMADLRGGASKRAPGSLAEPAGGVSGAPASQVRAGGGNRLSGLPTRFTPAHDAPQTFADARRVFDAAVALARAEPPVPIAGAEAWVESDGEYARRIGCDLAVVEPFRSTFARHGKTLDALGLSAGLPRARLERVDSASQIFREQEARHRADMHAASSPLDALAHQAAMLLAMERAEECEEQEARARLARAGG